MKKTHESFGAILQALEAELKACRSDEARLTSCFERAREIAGAERGFVLMAEPGTTEMRVVAACGVDPRTLWTTAEVSLSIIRGVLKEGRAVLSDNATVDPRFAETNSVVLSGLRSVLCVPIKSGRKTTALLYLDNRLQAGVFSQAHLDVMQSIARKVSRLSLPKPRRSTAPTTRKAQQKARS